MLASRKRLWLLTCFFLAGIAYFTFFFEGAPWRIVPSPDGRYRLVYFRPFYSSLWSLIPTMPGHGGKTGGPFCVELQSSDGKRLQRRCYRRYFNAGEPRWDQGSVSFSESEDGIDQFDL